jgi:molecular chaperone HtpG
MDNCSNDLIPEWMNFVYGILDSNDLPLNLSREMLQTNDVVQNMKQYVKKQVIKMIQEFSKENRDQYIQFYENYNKNLKWAITDGETRLENVLLWKNNKNNEYISFDDYIDKYLIEDQKQIFYITGDSIQSVSDSIFLQKFKEKNVTVLYMIDPIDEFVMQRIPKYKDCELVNISKDFDSELFKDKTEDEYIDFFKYMKEQLEQYDVETVKGSAFLKDYPICISSSKYGWSGHMEKVMKSQPLHEQKLFEFQKGKKVVEINVCHPLIQSLYNIYKDDENKETLNDKLYLLFSTASLHSGYTLNDYNRYSEKIYNLLK